MSNYDKYDLNDGFVRVSAISPEVAIADPEKNADIIIEKAREAAEKGVWIAVFPELSVTGYTCADLFMQSSLQCATERALLKIAEASAEFGTILIVGAPIRVSTALYNCAVVIAVGRIQGVVPKTYIPNYGEFYEKRWFAAGKPCCGTNISVGCQNNIPFGTRQLFKSREGVIFGTEICEDLWVPNPPSTEMALMGAEIIFNLSATNEVLGKHRYLLDLIRQQSARCRCGYVYASAGAGESSTDLVFSGNAIIAEDGRILRQGERFSREGTEAYADIDVERLRHDRLLYNSFSSIPYGDNIPDHDIVQIGWPKDDIEKEESSYLELFRDVEAHPFVPEDKEHLDYNCREVISIQSWGLEQRLAATGCRHLIVGISGGLDSTLALLVACHAFDRLGLPRTGIIGVTMPGLATTERTRNNATSLMEQLGVTSLEIPIGKTVAQHFEDIGQNPEKHDATYENSQARERTQILMDLANKYGGMVLGTGDLSELALGWCTYNGDHMSMYGVNASVPKTLVKHLVSWFADNRSDAATSATLHDIVDTPISPELIPGKAEEIAQRTEDLIGPYELHDFFLYHVLRFGSRPRKIYRLARMAFAGKYDDATIKKWISSFYRRFFSQQFKRSCMPDGPKTGSVSLSPRGDWRMPSDAQGRLWKEEAASL